MGIYVKGMKMPNSCGDCLMKVQYASGITWCEPMVKILATNHKPVCCYGRPDFCPLVEIPEPHGRLIDGDALMPKLKDILEAEKQIYGRASWDFSARCVQAVENAPTIESEIIRCKDCKHSSPNGKYGCKSYHYRLYETHEMKPDDFCSFAERRENE